ncbi:MAG: hypothetical protein KJS68_15055 [Alphaproteobacteria bacterium]|nr:hypothetical protein [Alphaproteobacteria bacterium]
MPAIAIRGQQRRNAQTTQDDADLVREHPNERQCKSIQIRYAAINYGRHHQRRHKKKWQ